MDTGTPFIVGHMVRS